jgi:hypothetical protein
VSTDPGMAHAKAGSGAPSADQGDGGAEDNEGGSEARPSGGDGGPGGREGSECGGDTDGRPVAGCDDALVVVAARNGGGGSGVGALRSSGEVRQLSPPTVANRLRSVGGLSLGVTHFLPSWSTQRSPRCSAGVSLK